MSTQDEAGIAFSISHGPQSFRLLELPQPLLALVTSAHPPILYLKSKSEGQSAVDAGSSTVVVCDDEQTFQVRQMQSSNLLYILQPSIEQPSGEYENSVPLTGMTAIGQCKALFELNSTPTAPISFLKQSIFSFGTERIGSNSNQAISDRKSRSQLLVDAPFSNGEFDSAWIELCAFELEQQAWRPSATTLLSLWKSFTNAVAVKGIDLTRHFDLLDVASMVHEEGFPKPLLQAMLRLLSSEQRNEVLVDQAKCVSWLGCIMLEASAHGTSIAASDFLTIWKDQLPEKWRESATLTVLDGQYNDAGQGNIQLMRQPLEPNMQQPAAVPTTKGTSKWHAKFKAARK